MNLFMNDMEHFALRSHAERSAQLHVKFHGISLSAPSTTTFWKDFARENPETQEILAQRLFSALRKPT